MKKPDPRIFAAAAQRASTASRLLHGAPSPPITPSEMLHGGDDLTNDYFAAKACGMRALLYDPDGGAKHEELKPSEVVHTLSEVAQKVDEMLAE